MLSRKPHRGFTLIELLVVVAIIALLISILLPSLQKARERARDTVCMTRLKSIGIAIEGYQGDNNGFVPPHISPDSIWHWELVTTYMSGQLYQPYEDFVCPTDRTRELHAYYNDRSIPQLEREQRWAFDISYGLSHVTYQDYAIVNDLADVETYHPEGHIRRPADTIVVTDSGSRDFRHDIYLRLLPNTLWNLLHRNYEGYVVDNGHRYPGVRHRGGSNVLFLDKHVVWADFDTLIPPENANGEKQVCRWWYRDMQQLEELKPAAHIGGY